MLLSEILDTLYYGELKQLSIGGADSTVTSIHPKHSTEVLSHINLAMLSLYSRFPLLDKELTLQTSLSQNIYSLTTPHTITNDPVNGYIIDTVENPFIGDLLGVSTVFNHEGVEFAINDEENVNSLFLPSYNTVQIPFNSVVQRLYIVYRAKPDKVIIPDGDEPSDVEVALPDLLLEPLLKYVSARVHGTRTGDKSLQESSILMKQYHSICNEIQNRNVLNSSTNASNLKLELNGWA